jgi:hypothetical protein
MGDNHENGEWEVNGTGSGQGEIEAVILPMLNMQVLLPEYRCVPQHR